MEYTCAGKVERVVPSTTFSSIVARSCPSTKDSLPDFCPSGKDKFLYGCYQTVSINPLDTILAFGKIPSLSSSSQTSACVSEMYVIRWDRIPLPNPIEFAPRGFALLWSVPCL